MTGTLSTRTRQPSRSRWSRIFERTLEGRFADASTVLLLMVLTGLFAVLAIDWKIPPFEDAAMLMRYAEHLAQGHGIVWNIGEPPVDGGTDFLFMACVAVVRYIGFSLEAATRLISILA